MFVTNTHSSVVLKRRRRVCRLDRSPEARYPVAIEQGYATAQWIVRELAVRDAYQPNAERRLEPSASPFPGSDEQLADPLSDTHATRAAIAQAIGVLRKGLNTA